jgi:putative DNA primase/helicase
MPTTRQRIDFAEISLPAPAESDRDPDAEREAVAKLAEGDVSAFLARAKADPGFPFEPEAVAALNSFANKRGPDFERMRARLKAETKVRVASLDALMKTEDVGIGAGDSMPGRPISYDEIEPWEEAVNGADLLTELSEAIASYVVMEKPQRDGVALWVVFAHAHDLRDYAPPLIVGSLMKRCGKTRLQETLARLVPRPQPTSGITAALFTRLIEKHRPTLFIDEYDAIAKGDREMAEALRGQLNSSFNKRSAVVLKLVPVPNEGWQERQFSTWAPTCIAGIGTVPDTVEDRSIMIRLARKLRGETVRRLRDKDGGNLAILARKIARFVNDNEQALRHGEPRVPDALNDRQADAWDPLFAIADVAGGDWPERAARTALALCRVAEAEAAERDVNHMLLFDVRDIFARLFPEDGPAHKAERIGRPDDGPRLLTKRLLDELHRLEERPWNAWGKLKKPMTDTDLASLLRPYRIRSDTVRSEDAMGNHERGKGYYLQSFKDAFSRYLLSEPSCRDSVTNPANAMEVEVSQGVTKTNCHGSQNAGNTRKSGICHGVMASMGRIEGGDEKGRDNGALRGHGSPASHETPHSENLPENSHKSVKPPRWSLEL